MHRATMPTELDPGPAVTRWGTTAGTVPRSGVPPVRRPRISAGSSPSRRSPARIALVDDHDLFAEVMKLALESEGHEVCIVRLGKAGRTVSSLLKPILGGRPGLVLLDLNLGSHGNGARLIEPLARSGALVVVLTGTDDRARWGEALASGARAVLSKCSPLDDILVAVRRTNQGLPVMGRDERTELVHEWGRERQAVLEARRKLERLTRREAEVLGHFLEGHQVRQVARLDYVSEATVRSQVKSILAKLEVSSQVGALGVAHLGQWQPPVVAHH